MAETVSYSRIPADAIARWKTVRDVVAGDQAVRAGGYLPELNKNDSSEQNKARNEAYKKRAVFFGATAFTRDGLIGLAFRKDPQSNLPEKLKYMLKDCDGAGTSIYQQSQDVLSHNLEVGRHGLYVDFSSGLNRPVIKSYVAEDIINWRTEMVDGQVKLTMVVLREVTQEDDGGGYGFVNVTRYRELKLVNGVFICKVWVIDDKGKESLESEVIPSAARNNGSFNYIPFTFVGSRNNDDSIDDSPLYNLAQINIAHFRNSADYEDSVFFCGQPQPWISGLDETWRDHLENPKDENGKPTGKTIYVGSRNPILLPKDAAFGFAQVEPNTLAKEAMDQKEKLMIAIGARMIEATTANKTATGEDNDREATTSVLALCVVNTTEAYQRAIEWCAKYLDITLENTQSYTINQDFVKLSVDSQLIQALVKAWQSGTFAKPDLRAYLRKMGVIAVERTDQAIEDDLETEGPNLGIT